MISARAIYEEIRNDDRTYALFLSVAAEGEAQGGWENARIAELTRDPRLRSRIERHGKDEEKHGRLFSALLRKRGLEPAEVPAAASYTRLLESGGIGLSHERLRRDDPLSDEELLVYLVHSRVTEQRAAEEVATQARLFRDDPELGKVIHMIADDEENHLAYCHEELLGFAARGHGERIRRMLREVALAEIRTYRGVSLCIMAEMGRRLGWPPWKQALLRLGIHAVYAWERGWGWRRLVRLRMPERRDALGGAEAAAPRAPS